MASELKTRITGKVVHTEKKNFGAGERAFSFLEVHIQSSVLSIVPVRFTDRWEWDQPRPGDLLDLEVSISARPFRGSVELSATAFRYFDETFVLELQTANAA